MSSEVSAVVSCPACSARCRVEDAACGACGGALARLQVIDGRRRVDATTTTVTIEIDNSGVVAAAVVLRRIDARTFPPWLVAGPTLDEAITIAPGARVAVRFELDPAKLPAPGQATSANPGRVVVPLVTSLVRFDAERGRVIRRVLAVELAIGGRAAVSPTHAEVPFLAIERLREGFVHVVGVENDGGHALAVSSVDVVSDGPVSVALVPDPTGTIIGAGDTVEIAVHVRAAADIDAVCAEAPVPARVGVTFTFADGSRRHAALALTIGRGPAVIVVDNPVIHTRGHARRAAVIVENPGQRPVRLQAALIGDSDGAWLHVVDDRPVVLGPGQRHSIELLVAPEARAEQALAQPWGERRLRLRHDGWQADADDRDVDVTVTAELGRTRTLDEATLGVDFGTSNSSVSMFHGPTGTLHALPLDRASGREALASLLFFTGDGGRGSGAVDGFLFGAAAENAAPQNFTNLVRQLKSVVARAPETEWNFVTDLDSDTRGGRVTKKTTPELLARFFTEIKRRAEDGLRVLPLPFLAELDLVDIGVRFRHAVFSHPVGVDDVMLRALHDAAVSSGLTTLDFASFKRERCVDEALAAVLAWVYLAASLPERDVPLVDEDRLLCFDAGGGTCDVAAVTIDNLASFRRRPGHGAVDVDLLANGGDPRFGGTDVDRLLASWLLDEAQSKPEMQGVDIDALRRALFYPSYEAWRRARGDVDVDGTTQRSRAIFHKSSDLLRAAERIKKTLSEASSASFVFVVDEWPKRQPTAPAGVRLELTITRERFETVCRPAFDGAAALIDPVIEAAGWRHDDVTTVLFTGQTSKIPALRRAVLSRLMARRAPHAPPPVVIEPGRVAAFDVKRCVAQGAAILGDSRRGGGGWLRVTRRSQTALSAPLQVRRGPLLVDVVGLEAGRELPASGFVALGEAATRLVLYRTGQPAFELRWDAPAAEITVVVESEGSIVGRLGDTTIVARRIA